MLDCHLDDSSAGGDGDGEDDGSEDEDEDDDAANCQLACQHTNTQILLSKHQSVIDEAQRIEQWIGGWIQGE